MPVAGSWSEQNGQRHSKQDGGQDGRLALAEMLQTGQYSLCDWSSSRQAVQLEGTMADLLEGGEGD